MKTTDEEILSAWRMFEDDDPDISTERLMQMTADFCKCDFSDVADALYRNTKEAAQ